MSRRILFLDCAGGVAGDMLLAALVEAAGCAALIDELPGRLGFADVELAWPDERPGGFAARRLQVHFDPQQHPHHRNYDDVCRIIDASGVAAAVADRAKAVFRTLAEAEGRVHGRPPDQVHFHEVGAVDAIVDILGTVIALAELAVDDIVCSPLPMGHGTVHCAHGALPLPAPAVAAMLPGVPVHQVDVQGETVTPTGAALVTTLAHRFADAMPAMTVEAVGVGAGSRSYPGLPNVVRAFVGTAREAPAMLASEHHMVECNVDDLDPRVLPVVVDRLLESGALDAYLTPLVMKKGRPGHLISALVPADKLATAIALLLHETTSLGCRSYPVAKHHLQRRMERVRTPWGEVGVKAALDGDRVLRRTPEFEDCAALARAVGVPVRDVLAAAAAAVPEDDHE